MRIFLKKVTVLVMACMLLSGCSKDTQLDDYATNLTGNSSRQSAREAAVDKEQTETVKKGISKDEIKVGVLHLSDPAEGSGYTYTHDLGIQGMQQNLGLSDDQIVRKINIPVICVLGLTQNSGKLKMELELQKCLKQKGYKVAAIVSGLNGLIGKDTFCFEKKYLNGKNRNEEIIININAAVKRLEQDYDIVIVGIPGACLSFNPQYSNDFGITTQLFMCAIEPDYSVLMLPYMRYEEAFISHVKDEVQKRYDITINDIGISEFAIDMDASFEQKKMCFLKLIDKERDFEHLKKISVVDIKSDSQIEKLSDRIIWTLEN